ncbi:MAG: hypothetical protein H0S84_06840 [Bacteroidales bacterium]|jgi:hypothetical protein|nr:hypothetical protein [Bacteroidales bacterium]MDN5349220.1 hypothetical protein [Bacteroidales bacterium]
MRTLQLDFIIISQIALADTSTAVLKGNALSKLSNNNYGFMSSLTKPTDIGLSGCCRKWKYTSF